jgi:hypothetical protein
MTMLFFGTHAQVIPDAWTRWTIGSREYERFEDGRIGLLVQPLPPASPGPERLHVMDVARPVDLTLRPKARKAVA